MSQAVVIKSNKYGIHLVLSNEISFKALLDAIVEKFKESETVSYTHLTLPTTPYV